MLDHHGDDLPTTVRDAVLARTSGLDPAAWDLLNLLTCSPGVIPDHLLAELGVTLPASRAWPRPVLSAGAHAGWRSATTCAGWPSAASSRRVPNRDLHRRLIDAYESTSTALGRLVRIDHPPVQPRFGARRDDAADRHPAQSRVGMPRRVGFCGSDLPRPTRAGAGSVTPRSASRRSGITPGEHVSRFSTIPRGGVEIRGARQHGVAHRGRQIGFGSATFGCVPASRTRRRRCLL